jgi:hypothetical protein
VIKLYMREDGSISYWEAWAAGRGIVVLHWGKLGEKGKTRQLRLGKGERSANVIAKHSEQPRSEGFREIPEEDHAMLVVSYRTPGWGSVKDLDKREKVEAVLNECLGWTGNGHCDGGDIGSGTINAFSLVVDPHLAVAAVVPALRKAKLLDGAVIAYRRGEEEYRVVWPEDFTGEFSID